MAHLSETDSNSVRETPERSNPPSKVPSTWTCSSPFGMLSMKRPMSVIMSSIVGWPGAAPGFVNAQSGFTLAEISLMAEMHAEPVHAEPVHAVKVDGTWSTSIDYHISLEPLGRRVRGFLNGVPVVDSLNARVMLEKGHLPVYIPREDVRTDLLVPSGTRTRCPYKGEAVYWSARMPERTVEDVVWSYPRPIAECPRIASLMCFFNEVVDAVRVGGAAEAKPRTKWSRD